MVKHKLVSFATVVALRLSKYIYEKECLAIKTTVRKDLFYITNYTQIGFLLVYNNISSFNNCGLGLSHNWLFYDERLEESWFTSDIFKLFINSNKTSLLLVQHNLDLFTI